MQRTNIGDFELTALSDGTYHLDGGAFFGIVPKVLWSKRTPSDEKNRVPTGLNSVLVRTGDNNILIETGVGNKLSDKMVQIYGQPAKLLDELSASGVSPDDIDIVINSHLHFDHCGWNTIRSGSSVSPTFPKAKYYAQKGNQEIVPGISVEVFPGHTRDMQAVIIQSGGKTACYISDLIPTSAHVEVNWVMGFDLYPLETIESRKRYYSRAIPENWLTMFTHDPVLPWSYLGKDERGKIVAKEETALAG
jgi:glyoxylase-like metal-dependent hydrolase (beta-lactamase superfamily II)